MSSQEKEMLESFNSQAKELLVSQERFVKSGHDLKIGLESEVAIHARLDNAGLVQKRDSIMLENPDSTDVELGASQIEIRTPPVNIVSSSGLAGLVEIYKQRFNGVLQSARKHEVKLLRVGANPFLPTIDTPRTNKSKYRLVPDFYNQHRNPCLDTVIGLGPNRIKCALLPLEALHKLI